MNDTTNDNRDVTLDIIGREHQALMAAGQQAHFTLVAELVLTILTLAFCFGWVTISPQLAFGGLTISTPQPYLLLVLAAIITALSWRVANLGLYGARVRKTIAARYDALGFTGHTDDTRFTAFAYPDLFTVLDASQAKQAAYLKSIFQQRPIRRGLLPLLTSLCWLVTLIVALVLYLVILFGPFVLDGYAGVFALQHRMSPFVVGVVIIALYFVNIASAWTSLQTLERKELLSPALQGAFHDIAEYAQYEADQTAVKGVVSADKQEGPEDSSEKSCGDTLEAAIVTRGDGGDETSTVA